MLSSADRSGRISSRYFGTPPVTASKSSFSRTESRAPAAPQSFAQSLGGISRNTKSRESRPTNPVPDRMFSEIHADTDPHKTTTSRGWRRKSRSHAFLSFPGKFGSHPPIHEISSSKRTVRSPSRMTPSNIRNASDQSPNVTRGNPVWAASCPENSSSWSALRCPGTGGRPENRRNRLAVRRANSSTNVLFPMRRRPRHVTSDGVFLLQRAAKRPSGSSRPMKVSMMGPHSTRPSGKRQEKFGHENCDLRISCPNFPLTFGHEI